jgi:hypothetical protein
MTAAWNFRASRSRPLRSPARIVALTVGSIASSSSLQPRRSAGIDDGESAATTTEPAGARARAAGRASRPTTADHVVALGDAEVVGEGRELALEELDRPERRSASGR